MTVQCQTPDEDRTTMRMTLVEKRTCLALHRTKQSGATSAEIQSPGFKARTLAQTYIHKQRHPKPPNGRSFTPITTNTLMNHNLMKHHTHARTQPDSSLFSTSQPCYRPGGPRVGPCQ